MPTKTKAELAQENARLRKRVAAFERAKAKRATQAKEIKSLRAALAEAEQQQAATAVENLRLFNETRIALERQTATAEILRVIGSSMTDTQPVFDAIVHNCSSLFAKSRVVLWLIDAENLLPRAETNRTLPDPMPIDRQSAIGVCVLDGTMMHLPDLEKAAKQYPRIRQLGLKYGYRSGIYAPLMRAGRAIGGLSVLRYESGAFDEREMALLGTFADQAVIAIENVRLFNETKEALERQTATAEILKVIASTPADVQPVFEAIARSANRLCGGLFANVFRFDGELVHHSASEGISREANAIQKTRYPLSPSRSTVSGRVILSGKAVRMENSLANPEYDQSLVRAAGGSRRLLGVPMLRNDKALGAIVVGWATAGSISPVHEQLLTTFADQAAIAIENVRLYNETKEALERQTATAEILKVISESPTSVQPVFDAIASCAIRLCESNSAGVFMVSGDQLAPAHTPPNPEIAEHLRANFPRPVDDTSIIGRSIVERRVIHVPDVHDPASPPRLTSAKDTLFGSQLTVPMMREGEAIGAIVATRGRTGPFSDTQIELLKTFADQAVIAIENVRLFNETRESLERQTATADILKVIAGSPTDVQPVFEAIAASAKRLLGGLSSSVTRVIGDMVHLSAFTATDQAEFEALKSFYPRPLSSAKPIAAVLRTGKPLYRSDIQNDPTASPEGKELARVRGYRSVLWVPLLRDGVAFGAITVNRAEAGTFSDHQIHLLETFADQAVIAIENVRLFNETKEALQRQTATAEILKVIASSPSDVQPVFDAIAHSSNLLIGGLSTAVLRVIGDQLHLAAYTSTGEAGDAALRARFPIPIAGHQVLHEKKTMQRKDVETDAPQEIREMARQRGWRSNISVPLVREDTAVGIISVTRREAGAFDAHHVALLETFADQAVIAIENVRLFNETKEALERQTTTAEILKVISGSPTDVQPVFDAIVNSAARLFSPYSATITMLENSQFHWYATAGTALADEKLKDLKTVYPLPFDPERSPSSRAISERRIIEIMDAAAPDAPVFAAQAGAAFGFRTGVFVPLLREGAGIGTIILAHPEPGFKLTDNQLALVQTFADQAVIAIENVRLFNETKEALERQTATSEILKVISSSPTNIEPVLESILDNAIRLCGGDVAALWRYDGQVLRLAAGKNTTPGGEAHMRSNPHELGTHNPTPQAALERRTVHVLDVFADPAYKPMVPAGTTGQRPNASTVLAVPLLRETDLFGVITIWRYEKRLFTDKQVEMVKTFADQAVIAIENVRLFKELEARTSALSQSVKQLTALGEVGQAISSTLELETVLQTIVSRAVQLTELDGGAIYEFDAQTSEFRLQIAENMAEELLQVMRTTPIRLGDGAVGRSGVTREPTQVPDTQDDSYQSGRKEVLLRTGYRAVLAVPLLREANLLGVLLVIRKTPGPFADVIVDLLKTFATQSAMAIQNARLFREIAEKGKQLEIASHHKSDFLASMSHELRTPLNAILGFNELIIAEIYGTVPEEMKEPLSDIQTSGKHLLRLINNVLDLAKIEAGRMELALADYSVHDTVESVRSTLRPLAADKGLEFVTRLPEDIPIAYGDSGRITQCLMNLAGNSLKFTKAGKVEISVELKGELLVYRVTDTGIGIPPDKIGSLFTEFKQTDATIASEYGGTGLGLSISRQFIEMHGGRVWVESELGKGSAFIFEIPLRVTSQTTAGATA